MIASILAVHLALAADPASSSTIVLTPEDAAAATAAAKQDDDLGWYGWETLLADGLSAGCFVGVLGARDIPTAAVLYVCGVGLYFFGGPLMHFRHERWASGLIDIGLRVVIPPAAYLVAYVSGVLGSGWYQLSNAPVALAAGALLAVGVDAFKLAWEPPRSARPTHASIQWAPFAGAVRGAPMAGVTGAF